MDRFKYTCYREIGTTYDSQKGGSTMEGNSWHRVDFLRLVGKGSLSGFHRLVSLVHLPEVKNWEYVSVGTDRGTYYLQGNEQCLE